MNAYGEAYLSDAQRNLGEAFDYATRALHIPLDEFITLFIASGYADSFGRGNPRLISGLSGTELVMETLTKAGLKSDFPQPLTDYDCSPEYWCGWALAYYQWKTGRSFRDLHKDLSGTELLKLYPTLHEASEDKFSDVADAVIGRRHSVSKIKVQRQRYGYSQKELAQYAGVNLRTLQQYESKAKDIDKASVQTVLSLANALGCRAEELLDFSGKRAEDRKSDKKP